MSSTQQLLLTEGSGAAPNYIEDVFSTYLYTGNNTGQTITNGIDLSTEGGMVWLKSRSSATDHNLYNTDAGVRKYLVSNTTAAQGSWGATYGLTDFNTNGFTLGNDTSTDNTSGQTYASWTFRKQPKFFDVVTYTGNGASQNIAHSLGSVPGCIIVKSTTRVDNWAVYHRSTSATQSLRLNTTAAAATNSAFWNNTEPTDAVFTLGNEDMVNSSGQSYVAYLFAHDAGGFGLTGTDNVISCGSFTTDGSGNATVSLGYEPQYILVKASSTTGNWIVYDTMRGWATTDAAYLRPNLADAEANHGSPRGNPTATGFTCTSFNAVSSTHIYIAIRRGPMKVPTDATKVFAPVAGTTNAPTMKTSFPVDSMLTRWTLLSTSQSFYWTSRLIGSNFSETAYSDAQGSATSIGAWAYQNGAGNDTSEPTNRQLAYMFRRAPSFMDVVCYTGNGSAQNITHNLGVVPELIVVKRRDGTQNWLVYSNTLGNNANLSLNTIGAVNTPTTIWNTTTPTSSVFSIGSAISPSGGTYVAYLFATCPGVSKVFTYTGNGSSQTINCGFAGGARFVLIKATSTTGNWYLFDTLRGMVSDTDPSLKLENVETQSSNTNACVTATTGFTVNDGNSAGTNNNGYTYIGIAIA